MTASSNRLGDLARDGGLAVAQPHHQRVERGGEAWARFVQDQRCADAPPLRRWRRRAPALSMAGTPGTGTGRSAVRPASAPRPPRRGRGSSRHCARPRGRRAPACSPDRRSAACPRRDTRATTSLPIRAISAGTDAFRRCDRDRASSAALPRYGAAASPSRGCPPPRSRRPGSTRRGARLVRSPRLPIGVATI